MAEAFDDAARTEGFVTGAPALVLRLEAAAALAAILGVYQALGLSWTTFAILFLVPDLSMLGYLAGRRAGSIAYNAAHTWMAPIALGALAQIDSALLPFALIWGAHVAFDRALGYGLKYATAFGDTHLGLVGKRRALARATA